MERDPQCLLTKKHFEELFKKYGSHIIILNLVKTIKSVDNPSMKSQEYDMGNKFTKIVQELSSKYFEKKVVTFIYIFC